MSKKRPRSPIRAESAGVVPFASSPPSRAEEHSQSKAKKLKLHESFAATSPFPDFQHPTSSEAWDVFNLLSNAHGMPTSDIRRPPGSPSNPAQPRSSVPNVIEALIETILSQNTSGKNSSEAKKNLDSTFGRNKFSAIAAAPFERVVEAIHSGGLANKKASTIQGLLWSIKRRHGDYSLQHLGETDEGKRMTNDAIMKELISFHGVGPKTASCVLLFSLGRDSFAVDTHVFRLSKLLGWVPGQANRILAQAHLELHVPAELKFGLHVLMIQHGRSCKGCSPSYVSGKCILKEYLKGKKVT